MLLTHRAEVRCEPKELSWGLFASVHFPVGIYAESSQLVTHVGRETTPLAGKAQCLHLAKCRLPQGPSRSSSVTQREECHPLSHQRCPGQLALPPPESPPHPDTLFAETTTKGHLVVLADTEACPDCPSSVAWSGLDS